MPGYPIRAETARKRTERQEATAERKEVFWRQRLAAADTPAKKAQVWWDRLRSVPHGASLPATLTAELWQIVIDDLQALCGRLEERVAQHRAEQQARQKVMTPKGRKATWW